MCRCAMIVYTLGECPGYNTMTRFVAQTQNFVVEPIVYLYEDGYFTVKFQSMNDCEKCVCRSILNYKLLILKPWTTNFDFNEEFSIEIPFCVKFPKLPMNYWGANSLSRIASSIGIPIFIDGCTAKQTRVLFVCMLIEINVTKALPEEVTVFDSNRKIFSQLVCTNGRQSLMKNSR